VAPASAERLRLKVLHCFVVVGW